MSLLASSAWPAEDAGPARLAAPLRTSGPLVSDLTELVSVSREVLVATMVVEGASGATYLLRHGGPPDAVAVVEQFDPVTLATLATSPDLAGGPVWPGGVGVLDSGDLLVVFGNHVHRLTSELELVTSRRLPRDRPYNSFVALAGGLIATKDFAGPFQGADPNDSRPSELLVLDPTTLEIVSSLELSEPSVARLSASGDEIVVVGVDSLLSVDLVDGVLHEREQKVRYRTKPGQGYGWDAVLDGDLAFFLDDGEGSEAFDGSFEGRGKATEPLRLHRIDRVTGAASSAEVCGLPGGLIANPPALDPRRRIVVGFDSGNSIVTAFDADELRVLWSVHLGHGSHPVVLPDAGEVVLSDFDRGRGTEDVVVLDIETGEERGRASTASPVQSVVFPAVGSTGAVYWVSFFSLSRIDAVARDSDAS